MKRKDKIYNEAKKASKGDNEAFSTLIHLVYSDLVKIAYLNIYNHSNINDAIQDTLISSYNNIIKLKKPEYFKTWIIKILINECNKINIKEKVYNILDDNVLDKMEDNRNVYKDYVDNESFKSIIGVLDYKYRMVVYLYYAEELTSKEISKILDINVNTVKSQLNRAKIILKEVYLKGGLE